MTDFSKLEIDLRQMVLAIEMAVSQVGMNDTNHGKRVGYIASQIGNQLGFSEQAIQYAFDLGLLHDCGVSTQQMHTSLVNQFDWSEMHIHCNIGYQLLKGFDPLSQFAIPILYHHTHWPELSTLTGAALGLLEKHRGNLMRKLDLHSVAAVTAYAIDNGLLSH